MNRVNYELEKQEYTTSIYINSKDRTIPNEATFNFNVSFGNNVPYNSSVLKTFKNIKSLEIENVIIPDFYIDLEELHACKANDTITLETNQPIDKSHQVNFKKLSDLPYIVLRIREFSQNGYGTNNVLNDCFAILMNDHIRDLGNDSRQNYSVSNNTLTTQDNFGKRLVSNIKGNTINNFINIGSKKMFQPTPKGVLNNLEISLHNPNGTMLEFMNDHLNGIECYNYTNSVAVASVANINDLPTPAEIDSYTLQNNDKVLLKDQTTDSENGIYTYNDNGGGTLTRDSDLETINKTFYIENGTTNKTKVFRRISSTIFRRENCLKIKMNQFFSSEEYKIGDTILLSSLEFGSNDNERLSKFLKRESGHTIINLFDDTNNSSTMVNTIVIMVESNVNNINGVVDYEDFSIGIGNKPTFNSLKIINESLQFCIQMNITFERYLEKINSNLL